MSKEWSETLSFSFGYLENLLLESIKSEVKILTASIEQLEKRNENQEFVEEEHRSFVDSRGVERKIEARNGDIGGIKTKIYTATLHGEFGGKESFYSARRHYDGKGNSLTKISNKNVELNYLNNDLICLTAWFDENLGISVKDGGLFFNEIRDLSAELIDFDSWDLSYFRFTEDSLKLTVNKKYPLMDKALFDLSLIVEKNAEGEYNIEHSYNNYTENNSSRKKADNIINALSRPFSANSIEEASELLDLNYQY